jgi:hypothetical protein
MPQVRTLHKKSRRRYQHHRRGPVCHGSFFFSGDGTAWLRPSLRFSDPSIYIGLLWMRMERSLHMPTYTCVGWFILLQAQLWILFTQVVTVCYHLASTR